MNIRDLIPWGRDARPPAAQGSAEDPVQVLQAELNRLFDAFWRGLEPAGPAGPAAAGAGGAMVPRVDVRQSDREVEVSAELPGMREGDVEVSAAERALVIRGDMDAERESKGEGYLMRERRVGRIERVVPLPEGLDLDQARAEFRNGVLTVTIPRTREARAGARRIPVQQS